MMYDDAISSTSKMHFIADKIAAAHFNILKQVPAIEHEPAYIVIRSADDKEFNIVIERKTPTIEVCEIIDGYRKCVFSAHRTDSQAFIVWMKEHITHHNPEDPAVFSEFLTILCQNLNILDNRNPSRWIVVKHDSTAYQEIRNTEKHHESIIVEHKPTNRYVIRGAFPWINGRAPSVTSYPQITVSNMQRPINIARAIVNRLLPNYRLELSEVVARETAEHDFQNRRIEIAKEINLLMGSEWKPASNFNMQDGTPVAQPAYPYGVLAPLLQDFQVTVHSETSVDIRLSLKNSILAKKLSSLIMNTIKDATNNLDSQAHAIPDAAFIEAAREIYMSDIEIDSNATVSRGDDPDGVYVEGWLWVSNADAEQTVTMSRKRKNP